MTIGERIRKKRTELGMTQEELARKAGYKSRSSINKIELSRDLPLRKIQKVAEALELSPTELAGWVDATNTEAQIKQALREINSPMEERDARFFQKAVNDRNFMSYIGLLFSLKPEYRGQVYGYIDSLVGKEKNGDTSIFVS